MFIEHVSHISKRICFGVNIFSRNLQIFHSPLPPFNVPSQCYKFTSLKDILNQIYTYKIFTTLFFCFMLNYVLLRLQNASNVTLTIGEKKLISINSERLQDSITHLSYNSPGKYRVSRREKNQTVSLSRTHFRVRWNVNRGNEQADGKRNEKREISRRGFDTP